MRETKTTTTYICDLCGAKHDTPDPQRFTATMGYKPVEACGVTIIFQTFGLPVNEMYVCAACQRRAVHAWLGEAEKGGAK